MTVIRLLDQHFQQQLEKGITPSSPQGLARFLIEFLYFGVKEARACIFVGLFFLAVFSVPKAGWFSIPRYDLLLIFAILIQGWMVASKLETWDELKAVTLFHLVGFALEVFKTSSGIRSWSYPDFAYTKVFGVPLFAGFMYASVGSYIIQSWRLFDLKIRHHPPYWLATLVAILIYANFFTHHYIGDYRWYIAALAVGLYARTTVIFTSYDRERRMPLSLAFILIGFFIWLAENISTFFSIWNYPEQLGAWSMVHVGKWSSWALLVIMTFTIVIYLKNIKKSIHVPE
ncbi:DUF817 domain-containing protein [Pectobacterium parmentieri]|uniref:Conserved membrane protein YoaT n=1 Tax=Pectobacterium parmentieri TaxID=1905730 RepID=A0A0H3I6A1_PECPM|nr:DUF817 domain-containing protein [Pectobacterium parmentieri]AFI89466.1 Conserved membrane protein YoaT [Pectobacterium parmentieri]MBI0469423.1 DUF817 domain-containing protein [Pectobacterium parmentieri]MBI0492047.1 DUF817 domain-containing protein [Pectobacterium parmentieri]MBI0554643.1 DUF817 domain-containing protein [Pectobacterium parmentieri]MBI0566593.1 DUF817 domain-containing protein [Pectobacterium parmentieri]